MVVKSMSVIDVLPSRTMSQNLRYAVLNPIWTHINDLLIICLLGISKRLICDRSRLAMFHRPLIDPPRGCAGFETQATRS